MKHKVPVLMENVKAGMVTAGPVYARNEEGMRVMLVKAETALTDDAIGRLNRYHVKSVSILSESPDAGGLGIRSAFMMPKVPRPRPVLDNALATEALKSLQGLFDVASGTGGTTAYRAVKQLDDVVDHLVETVSSEISGLVHISQLKSHDDYTYHHSLSVAVLSIAIGRALNLNKARLRELGRTSIMHDIGKILIPLEVLNKPGKLTNEEFEIMKSHSAKGALYLKKERIGDEAMWAAVRAHHEKVDGTGYPDRLKGNEIPYFARIISVADVYDAVTSYRPYRGPMSPSVAFELVMSDVGRAFEYEIVSAFAKTVEFYPKGTAVLLSNDRRGVVVNNINALRPTLQMLDNGEILDLTLLDNLHLVVERVEDHLTAPELMEQLWEDISDEE